MPLRFSWLIVRARRASSRCSEIVLGSLGANQDRPTCRLVLAPIFGPLLRSDSSPHQLFSSSSSSFTPSRRCSRVPLVPRVCSWEVLLRKQLQTTQSGTLPSLVSQGSYYSLMDTQETDYNDRPQLVQRSTVGRGRGEPNPDSSKKSDLCLGRHMALTTRMWQFKCRFAERSFVACAGRAPPAVALQAPSGPCESWARSASCCSATRRRCSGC